MKTNARIVNPIFKRKLRYGRRALFYLAFSLVLIVADHKNAFFHAARQKLAIVDMPFFYSVNLPVQGVELLVSNVATRVELLKENAQLKAENTLLQAKLQKLLSVETDNSALLSLLEASAKTSGHVLEAEIIAVVTDPFQHQVIVNKGSQAKTFVGQPVLDAYGVMGQVTQVEPLISRVTLITSGDSAIPIQNSRNGVRAIASGDPENGLLNLNDVPQTTSMKVGDLLVTSGLGGHYPVGYPVAKIISVVKDPNQRFSTIKAKPLAHMNRTRLVLLAWPSQKKLFKAVEAMQANEKSDEN